MHMHHLKQWIQHANQSSPFARLKRMLGILIFLVGALAVGTTYGYITFVPENVLPLIALTAA